jgi:hypothetical protein
MARRIRPTQRSRFALFIDGWTYSRIAGRHNVSHSSAKDSVRRAARHLFGNDFDARKFRAKQLRELCIDYLAYCALRKMIKIEHEIFHDWGAGIDEPGKANGITVEQYFAS